MGKDRSELLHIGALVMICQVLTARAHTRLVCPEPRSLKTGAKQGPCDAADDPNQVAFQLTPGYNTIHWEESISHPGAPARFALSRDGDDSGASFESCLLLDHVPHDDNAYVFGATAASPLPNPKYHQYMITLWLPDVQCTRCHLQLVTYMTDDAHSVPVGTSCANKFALQVGKANSSLPACPVVYHSCAPVTINGSVPRNDYTCNLSEFEQKLNWPFAAIRPPPSEYYFKGDAGVYDAESHFPFSGGTPIQGCSNTFFCDPQNGDFSNYSLALSALAKYRVPAGTCAPVPSSTTSTRANDGAGTMDGTSTSPSPSPVPSPSLANNVDGTRIAHGLVPLAVLGVRFLTAV